MHNDHLRTDGGHTADGGRMDDQLAGLQMRDLHRGFESIEDLRQFFGADSEDLLTSHREVNKMDLLMVQRALAALLPGWRCVRERRYVHRGQDQLAEQMAVEVAPGRYDFMLRCGRQFWEGPGTDDRLTTDVYVDDDPAYTDSTIRFSMPRRKHGGFARLLADIDKWVDEHHYLRGQAIDARGRFLRTDEAPDWEDVTLPAGTRAALQANVLDLLKHRALYMANGIPLRRGVILHGPPGTGKTLIGRVLARRTGATFILVTPGMINDAEDISRVFGWARRWAPTILFFEDFDMVAGSRYGGGDSEELGEFLSCLDGVDSHEGVISIATTNDLEALEGAVRDRPNRFDCVLQVPPFDREHARLYLERWVASRAATIDLDRWSRRADGFTGAQLQELCRLAVIAAIEAHLGTSRPEVVALTILDAHFETAIGKMPVKSNRKAGFRVAED